MDDIVDDYEHLDDKLIYVVENIPFGEATHLFEEEFSLGCNCDNYCLANSCHCVKNNVANYTVRDCASSNGKLYDKYMLNNWDGPIYECNKNCKCSQDCGNKLVQYGPRSGLEIFATNSTRSSTKGLGLLTKENVTKGSFVCEYAGEVLTKDEAVKRYMYNESNSLMNYIFCFNEHYGDNIEYKHFVDPSHFGNIGRYINHSCMPNCKVIPVRVNNDTPKLSIFAIRDIPTGDEITFSYGDDSQTEEVDVRRKICLCTSENCKQFMPFYDKI